MPTPTAHTRRARHDHDPPRTADPRHPHPTRAVLGTGSSATPSSGRGPPPSLDIHTVPLMPRLGRLFANERAPLIWGLVWGAIQAASPLGLWWLDAATVYALSLALIASIYVGFAVADGRPTVVAVETTVAGAFVVVAAASVTGSAWLLVLGLIGHGFKDLWQHRTHYVANTRWWPPFCLTVDWIAATIIAIEIAAGLQLHR